MSYGGRCTRARVCMCGRMLRPCAICEYVFICVFYTRGSLCMRLCIRVKKNRRKSRRYAFDSHVASVILSVYYAKRWAGNNSFSRVLRSIRSDPSLVVHRASRERRTPFAFKPCALRENARDEKFIGIVQGRIRMRLSLLSLDFLNRSEISCNNLRIISNICHLFQLHVSILIFNSSPLGSVPIKSPKSPKILKPRQRLR